MAEKKSPGPIVFVLEDRLKVKPYNFSVAIRTGKKTFDIIRTDCTGRAAKRIARLIRRAITLAMREVVYTQTLRPGGSRFAMLTDFGGDAEVSRAGGEKLTSGKSAQAGTEFESGPKLLREGESPDPERFKTSAAQPSREDGKR